MIYEAHYGKTEPFEIALPKLRTAFTPEQLIEFTTDLAEFRSFFEKEKETALEAKQEEFLEALDVFRELETRSPNDPERQQARAETDRLELELKDIENSFFANKARQLFLDAGFFTTQPPTK